MMTYVPLLLLKHLSFKVLELPRPNLCWSFKTCWIFVNPSWPLSALELLQSWSLYEAYVELPWLSSSPGTSIGLLWLLSFCGALVTIKLPQGFRRATTTLSFCGALRLLGFHGASVTIELLWDFCDCRAPMELSQLLSFCEASMAIEFPYSFCRATVTIELLWSSHNCWASVEL